MSLNVEVDQVITSGHPFDVTLSADDDVAVCTMTVSVNGKLRSFTVKPPVPSPVPDSTQTLNVGDQDTYTVSGWGVAKQGDLVEVKLNEKAPGTRAGSAQAAVV